MTLAILPACNSDEKIKGYKSNEILVVTLNIEDNIAIEKITLESSYGKYTDSILSKDFSSNKSIKLKCPQMGEGTFSICVFTNRDTLCSKSSYVEGGYRPTLRFKNNKFETIDGF